MSLALHGEGGTFVSPTFLTKAVTRAEQPFSGKHDQTSLACLLAPLLACLHTHARTHTQAGGEARKSNMRADNRSSPSLPPLFSLQLSSLRHSSFIRGRKNKRVESLSMLASTQQERKWEVKMKEEGGWRVISKRRAAAAAADDDHDDDDDDGDDHQASRC